MAQYLPVVYGLFGHAVPQGSAGAPTLAQLEMNGAQKEEVGVFPRGELPQLSLGKTHPSQIHCKECTNALLLKKGVKVSQLIETIAEKTRRAASSWCSGKTVIQTASDSWQFLF